MLEEHSCYTLTNPHLRDQKAPARCAGKAKTNMA